MKLFQTGQKYMAMMGIYPTQSLINVNFFLTIFASAINIIANWAFLVFEASSFREYTNSIFITSTITMIVMCEIYFTLKKSRIFAVIALCENQIAKSELIHINQIL